MDELVQRYIALRDAKDKIRKAYLAKVATIEGVMDKIEAHILGSFNESGIDSVRTAAGTAYRQTRTSASVADWELVLDYVRKNELWHMLERRVSKDAVEAFKSEHGDLPPGINWREETVINVRRS